MNQIVEELAALYSKLESPLIQAHHADVEQPWSGLAEVMVEVRPNPDFGPVSVEVSVENTDLVLAKEVVAHAGVSQVRFDFQTEMLPDGPAVLRFTAEQDRFIWESSLPFRVSNTPDGIGTVPQNQQTGTPILFVPPASEEDTESSTNECPVLASAANALTVFQYACACGGVGCLERGSGFVRCRECGATYSTSASGVIDFLGKKTNQNAYFDAIYEAGHMHKTDELSKGGARTYENSYDKTQVYLNLCGIDPGQPVNDLSILDAACGAGWVTAGLLSNPMVHRCRLHAYDLSANGLEMLARFAATVDSTNLLEMSIQDANQMVFREGTFDLIIGSSVLHHFDDVPGFLAKCRKILKPGGAAVFGEPFALGHGLAMAALMTAQRQLGLQYPALDAVCHDITYRIQNPKQLDNLVDKHLFFQSSFLSMALNAGFSNVTFTCAKPRDYYRDQFISALMAQRGVSDPALLARANEIYRTFFDIFDAESYAESLGAFIHIVLRA